MTAVDAEGQDPLRRRSSTPSAAAGEAAAAGGEVHIAGPAGLIADLGAAFAGHRRATAARRAVRRAGDPRPGVPGGRAAVRRAVHLDQRAGVGRRRRLPAGEERRPAVERPEPGHPVHPGGRRGHRLRRCCSSPATGRSSPRSSRSGPRCRRAWRACMEPIAASAGTVIIGLLCLLLSDLNSNRSLGPVGAIGIASAFVAAMTLLPALLMAGRWLFWPRIPVRLHHGRHEVEAEAEVGRARRALPVDDVDLDGADWTTQMTGPNRLAGRRRGLWGRISVLVGRHPRRIWVVTAIALAIACLVRADPEGVRDLADRRVPHRRRLDRRSGGACPSTSPAASGNAGGDHRPGGGRRPRWSRAVRPSTASPVSRRYAHGRRRGPQAAARRRWWWTGPVQIQATLTAAADSEERRTTVRAVRDAVHARRRTAARSWSAAPRRSRSTPSTPRRATCG